MVLVLLLGIALLMAMVLFTRANRPDSVRVPVRSNQPRAVRRRR